MHALLQVDKARRYVARGHENARLAAHAALLAGLYANDAAVRVQRLVAGGRITGAKKTEDATKNDSIIQKLSYRWHISDDLQEEFRSSAAYIQSKRPELTLRTIQRRLKVIDPSRKNRDSS